jgi:hypothetical protein
MPEFPIRAGDVLIVFSKEPSVHYKVGRVDEDGQYRFTAASRVRVEKTEAAAVDHARSLARILARLSTCNIYLKDAKTGEWRQIKN